MRAVGQTAAGFQVGVQRTVPQEHGAVWRLLVTRADLWLGAGAPHPREAGVPYRVVDPDGRAAHGEVRVVRTGARIRLTWHPEGCDAPARVEVSLTARHPGRTVLHVQIDRLPDAGARRRAREHWRAALDRLIAAS
ncbi:MAG TPA: SRPBCC domain-containing protein [Miltoncostaeaceae bacterium]|nr:SRPBCC domain-containing protein [Miltoncostaeaceae bacterium]